MRQQQIHIWRKMSSVILILTIIFWAFVSGNVTRASEAIENKEREVIKVGFFAFDGYHMIDEDGERRGYGYDFLRLISRYLDVDYEYVGYENSWDDMTDMLRSGEIDMVTSAQVTADRLEDFEFSKPIGTSCAMLTTRQDNHEISAFDYSTYDGISIGMLEGNSRNEDMENYAKEHGFSFTPVYFSLHTQLEEALQSGAVDAALTSSLRHTEKEKILDTFAVSDFYVIVRMGDTELLDQVNYAIDQINSTEGDWKTRLNNKYYNHLDEKNLSFTEEEQELIRQYTSGEKKLVMSASMDRAPYSYVEDGELKGIIIDYFARLTEYIGIPYEIRTPSNREEYEQWRMEGMIDGTMDARVDSERWVEENSYSFSGAYTTMRLAMVTRRDFNGEIKKLAVATAQGLFGLEKGIAPEAQQIEVPTREEGMQAVLDGKADAAIVYLYTAQQFVNQDERGLLTYTLLEEPTYDYHVAFTPSVSHELAGIFTKAIYAMPEGLFEEIASQYTSYKAEDIDLLTWIKIYPLHMVVLLVGLFLLILLAVLLFERQKVIRLEQRRSTESRQLAAQAERANHAKSDFLANVSHDIRTPMNAIVGIVNLMEQEPGMTLKLHEYIRKIRGASSHLLSLIDNVLDMSRIEANRVSLSLEPIDLRDQIDQVEAIAQELADQREQTLQVQVHTLSHCTVIADGVRLRQILLNFLSNAVKYTERHGLIRLELEELPCDMKGYAKFHFSVTDNGCGMSQEFVSHIFEPFVRNEASVTNKVQGTGLGMAITKKIVDLMNGEIFVNSELGKGTCFEVILTMPIASKEQIDDKNPQEKSALQGMRFLCAEDNELNAEILEAMLDMYGASCTICPDGAKLVEMFDTIEPDEYDAILMDIQMPNMNGLEAARAIRTGNRRLGKTIPIIAMSANAFKEDVERSIEAGMNAHISKPIDTQLLEKVLSDIIYHK